MAMQIHELLSERSGENFELHSRYMNHQFVKVLRTIGFDKTYTRAEGQYLFDDQGRRFLDLLSGFGVYSHGRNHPRLIAALRQTLEGGLSNLVQMECSLLSGLLAEAIVKRLKARPSLAHLNKTLFCNSGAEAVEIAIKFARAATGRDQVVHCKYAYHGLTNGALSVNGDGYFKARFGSLLPCCHEVPFGDLESLEECLRTNDAACFIVEPIQGKSLLVPGDGYFQEAARLCRKYGTLLVLDEVQTGLGRTGKFLAAEHWQIGPDIVTLSKGLSGGFVPVGAVAMREEIHHTIFNSLENAAVHMSTFAGNNLAMAAGLASLEVLDDEDLIARSEQNGERLMRLLRERMTRHEFFKEVRGKGMMIGVEFGKPAKLTGRAAWHVLDKLNKGLFCQLVVMPLLTKHGILTQVAGHESYVVKLLPPFTITEEDIEWTVDAFDQVLGEIQSKMPSAVMELASNLSSA